MPNGRHGLMQPKVGLAPDEGDEGLEELEVEELGGGGSSAPLLVLEEVLEVLVPRDLGLTVKQREAGHRRRLIGRSRKRK